MNYALLKKVALIVGLLAVVVILVKNTGERQKTESVTPSPAPILSEQAPPPTPTTPTAPTAKALKPTISMVYVNKSIPPQFYQFFHRFNVLVTNLGPFSALTIVTPETLEYPKIEGVTQKTLTQKTWKDNLFKYSSILKPAGEYNIDLVSSGRIEWQASCSAKSGVATCYIVPAGTKITQ